MGKVAKKVAEADAKRFAKYMRSDYDSIAKESREPIIQAIMEGTAKVEQNGSLTVMPEGEGFEHIKFGKPKGAILLALMSEGSVGDNTFEALGELTGIDPGTFSLIDYADAKVCVGALGFLGR